MTSTKTKQILEQQFAVIEGYSKDALRCRYRAFFHAEPGLLGEDFMRARIMCRLQELFLGGLNEAEKAVIASLQQKDDRVNPSARPPRKAPVRHVVYERTYKGKRYILEHHGGNRYYLDDTCYKSLSAAAKAVTGTHLSGKAFWGLAE